MGFRSSNKLKMINRYALAALVAFVISLCAVNAIEMNIYAHLNMYWFVIPIILSVLSLQVMKLFDPLKQVISSILSVVLLAGAFFSTLIILKCNNIHLFVEKFEEKIWIALIIITIMLRVSFLLEQENCDEDDSKSDKNLFNLFYVNTSKMHEIAMLIDNTIMKTVEKNQSFESLLKNERKLSFGPYKKGTVDYGQSIENSFKKDVYESFDVKTTKSILLDRIYSALPTGKNVKLGNIGQVILFNNVNLIQANTDDTVFVLNVLKDSNMKNKSDDGNLEVNISRMLDEMLEDFTIDYTFEYDKNNFLIRIPFKSKDYFENNYSHNDLQLGALSVIGIYRGEIDFNEINSISTKFLQMLTESYNNEMGKVSRGTDYSLTHSSKNSMTPMIPTFDLQGHKELGKKHLIDLIAIIQEIQIDEED